MDSFEIKGRYGAGDYKAIIKAYETELPLESPWDYFYYASALRKVKEYAKGREIAKKGMLAFPDFLQIRTPYAWCLYYLYIRDFAGEEEKAADFTKAVGSITRYAEQSTYTPYERTVDKYVRYLQKQRTVDNGEIIRALTLLNPDALSAEAQQITTREGLERTLESPRERWYSQMTKYLLRDKQYERCTALCQAALQGLRSFHHDNDSWFHFRLGQCAYAAGDWDGALKEYRKAGQRRSHWCFSEGLFLVYAQKGEHELALRAAASGLLEPGVMAMKVRFLKEVGFYLLQDENSADLGYDHLYLCRAIYEKNNWKTPRDVADVLPEAGGENPKAIHSRLRTWWQEHISG